MAQTSLVAFGTCALLAVTVSARAQAPIHPAAS